MEVSKLDIVLLFDCRHQTFSLFILLKVVKTLTLSLLFEHMRIQKYICSSLPFSTIEVDPTMTTSTAENHGNVKKVHWKSSTLFFLLLGFGTPRE